MKLADHRWLTSSAASEWLELARQQLNSNTAELTVLNQLRKKIDQEKSRQVLTLAKLRIKAAKKFANAQNMFFTDTGLQQSSSQTVAEYKSSRFAPDKTIFDLCCGIGGDLLGLAKYDHVVAVDKNEVCCQFARANLAANDLSADVHHCEIGLDQIPASAWVHIDPSRREQSGQRRRTTRLEHYQPPESFLDQLLQRQPGVALKLAPATETPPHWQSNCERQWIGHENQCKQQMLWAGHLANAPGRKSVAVIDAENSVHQFVGNDPTDYRVHQHSDSILSYVYEPHAAIRAARLEADLAESLDAKLLPTTPSFFTTAQHRPTPFANCFEVRATTSKKQLAAELSHLNPGHVEFKCRPPYHTLEKIQKSIRLSGTETFTVIALPIQEKLTVLICRRI